MSHYSYDDDSQLSAVTYNLSATALGSLTYAYDGAGQRILIGGSWARSNLPPALASATYDDGNQISSWGGTAFVYDDNGNLVDDGVNTYVWNARNELASIAGTAGASFEYDGVGRRRERTIGTVSRQFLYDGTNPVQELSSGSAVANLLTGLGIDEYFTRITSSAVEAFLTDALGSPVAITDTFGAVQTEYSYEPFGHATRSGSASDNNLLFTGREDDGTGLHYYRARYYDSRTQRFLSDDPLGYGGGDSNLYAYVKNRPTVYVDPQGLSPSSGRGCAEGPECFAQLKYRQVADGPKGSSHTFWYVQDSSGVGYIISGGPTMKPSGYGKLNVWPRTNMANGDDRPTDKTWWDSGLSSANCSFVDRLVQAAKSWPNNWIDYYPGGPNSNTAASHLGNVAGFSLPIPPGAVGWGDPIFPPSPTGRR